MSRPAVVVVAKRTSWNNYVEKAQDPLVLELLRRGDPSVAKMRAAHETHEASLRVVEASLARHDVEVRPVEDASSPFSTEGVSLVITVGGDGTLLTTSHHVAGVPMLGVNSAPGISIGFFCGSDGASFDDVFERFLTGSLPSVSLSRMEVLRNGNPVSRRVLNDALVCHNCPAATSRYILDIDGVTEEQRSSGLWIGPAAGSTAAQRSAGGQVLPLDSEIIQLVVREPYVPEGRTMALTRHLLQPGRSLRVRSKMYEGRLFLDGPTVCESITLGDVLEFRLSAEPLTLLAMTADRTRGAG